MTKTIALFSIIAIAGCHLPAKPAKTPLTADEFKSALTAYLSESKATARYLDGQPTAEGVAAHRAKLFAAYDRLQLPDVPMPYSLTNPKVGDLLEGVQKLARTFLDACRDQLARGGLDHADRAGITKTGGMWILTCDRIEGAMKRIEGQTPR